MLKHIPLVFTPQPEGGFTVTSLVVPELLIEGDTPEEACSNVKDAMAAVIELYADQGRDLPPTTALPDAQIVWSDALMIA
jgi:antitoxin HicB